MPEPGPYGPVSWSHPRPWTLWAYVVVYFVSAIFHVIFIAEEPALDAAGSFLLLPTLLITIGLSLVILYFMWRGSKIAWAISVFFTVMGIIVSLGELSEARRPGGHDPVVHAIETLFAVTLLLLLLLPQTRAFFRPREGEELPNPRG